VISLELDDVTVLQLNRAIHDNTLDSDRLDASVERGASFRGDDEVETDRFGCAGHEATVARPARPEPELARAETQRVSRSQPSVMEKLDNVIGRVRGAAVVPIVLLFDIHGANGRSEALSLERAIVLTPSELDGPLGDASQGEPSHRLITEKLPMRS